MLVPCIMALSTVAIKRYFFSCGVGCIFLKNCKKIPLGKDDKKMHCQFYRYQTNVSWFKIGETNFRGLIINIHACDYFEQSLVTTNVIINYFGIFFLNNAIKSTEVDSLLYHRCVKMALLNIHVGLDEFSHHTS